MPDPKTPLKADEAINRIILDLSANWDLQLPIRDNNWSPAKHDVQSVEQQIYSSVKVLFFKDKPALDAAIDQFRRQAPSINSKWRFKPMAEADVIPSRTRREGASREDFLIDQVEKDEKAIAELRQCLLEKVQNAYKDFNGRKGCEGAKRNDTPPTTAINHDMQQEPPGLPLPQSRDHRPKSKNPEKKKQSTLKEWCMSPVPRSAPRQDNSASVQHPSSDEYPLHQDDMQAMDIDTSGNVYGIFQDGRYRSEEVGFKTAPTTPSDEVPVHREAGRTISENFVFEKPEIVPVKPLADSPTRKRVYEDAVEPSMQRKVSREERMSSSSRRHVANHAQPTEPFVVRAIPDHSHAVRHSTGMISSTTSTGLERSFESNSSLRSFMTGPSTGLTTPNTSFGPASTATSFDAYDQSEPSIVASEKMLPGLAHEVDDLDFDPMELDDRAEKLKQEQRPEILNPAVETYLRTYLFEQSPFNTMTSTATSNLPFRQRYEIVRTANACGLPISAFESCLLDRIDDYEILWSRLTESARLNAKVMPERSNLLAWAKAETKFEGVALSGILKYNEKASMPMLTFVLNPLKLERSYRLSRKYGGDRFCVISISGVDLEDIPTHLKAAPGQVRSTLIDWLVDEEHNFLGRKWRAFFLKPDPSKKTTDSSRKPRPGYRVFFFAENGDDFLHRETAGEMDPRRMNHVATTRDSMLEWFMPAMRNKDELALKFFARLALAVSSTRATIEFKPQEIIRTDNARADNPQRREISISRSDEKKLDLRPDQSKANVMNDGCARISRAAAKDIANSLGTDYVPSVFQGRIAGAKGIWMIDALDKSFADESFVNDRGYWIEITDNQLKFAGHVGDQLVPDSRRVTFEVQSWSKKLSPASLNFQLIPILKDRGVPYEVFKRLLEEDLTAKISELEAAMASGLDIRAWNQDNNPVTGERIQNKGIEMLGGLPSSRAEKINWFVEHGFQPKTCRFLKDLLYKAIHDYCMRLENRMKISVSRSTYAFMIADPLAQLAENEIHIGFSNLFRDSISGWNEVMLHDIDVLVARSPALLPSDIQKVRAVFKPELGVYRDVVVFPSKGDCALAEKLSGGDYDGDKAWICWDPDIVGPFQEVKVPKAPPLAEYGICKDTVKVNDLISQPDYISKFLRHGFDFNLQPSLLGSCTLYHEAMCYATGSINGRSAISIAFLLGLLVDRAKAGIIFDEAKWNAFLSKCGLPRRFPKPYYKDKEKARPTGHLIDRLVSEVAKGIREKALGNFSRAFSHAGTQDEDLVRRWKEENEDAKDDSIMMSVLSHLKIQLRRIHDYWKDNTRGEGDENEKMSSKRSDGPSFSSVVEKCRVDFINLEPLPVEGHPTVAAWRRGQARKRNDWNLLKASALYHEWRHGGFSWYVAGVELGELKATAGGSASYTPMVMEIASALKLDSKMARRRERAEIGEVEEDEYGSDIDLEDMDDIG